ncbi:DNA processing protein DprA, partial [Vibrio parahaemolyticus]
MINLNKDQKLAWCHAALILTKKVSAGSVTSNKKLREMLTNIGSLEDIYNQHFGMIPIEEKIESQ